MMWMPLRASKMKGFILGFHRRVWCPKWTPASNNSLTPIVVMFSNSNELTPNLGEPIPRNTGFNVVLLWPPDPHGSRQFKAVFLRNDDELGPSAFQKGRQDNKGALVSNCLFPCGNG